ncbi:hypothetical protein GCM10010841_26110 [Deinococcus aerophilus]|uniref:Uncharacterized protein n=1 Tax=Deinococcus aerophilus TaxID=522488 RepID=A0ABQ2GXJ7_9DEIO|nr:hypothetical protein GCM10010841_26110 [Deinococcus aerophilus]
MVRLLQRSRGPKAGFNAEAASVSMEPLHSRMVRKGTHNLLRLVETANSISPGAVAFRSPGGERPGDRTRMQTQATGGRFLKPENTINWVRKSGEIHAQP